MVKAKTSASSTIYSSDDHRTFNFDLSTVSYALFLLIKAAEHFSNIQYSKYKIFELDLSV